jgi:hypothetical protein
MSKVLLIVPTRGRPEKAQEFYDAYKDNSPITDLVFGLDDDDVEYPRIPGVMYEVNPRAMMNGTLNLIAKKYADAYDYIAFMGDDHRIRTPEWDIRLVEAIKGVQHGIAYGNDLLQGENLPTAVLLNASIVRKLGFMAPVEMKHLYLDNFWRDMGKAIGSLRYLDDVVIEHMHYLNGKAVEDAGYQEVNSTAIATHDYNAYQNYVRNSFEIDKAKLL